MPASILVVEGTTDRSFFASVLQRLYPATTSVEILIAEGQSQIPDTVSLLLRRGIVEFAVAQDLDRREPTQLAQGIQSAALRQLGKPDAGSVPLKNRVEIDDRVISVLPVGMLNDTQLTSLGIHNHTVEDYLVKLMLPDPNLRRNAPMVPDLLAEILPRVRHYDGDFDSGKELFQLIKPIVQHGFSDTAITRYLIEHADAALLCLVLAPLLPAVAQAFGLAPAP